MTRAFFERLTTWRELLLENMVPALVAPMVWMTIVSFAIGQPFIRKLGLIAVGPLGALVSGMAALIILTIGRRTELRTATAALLAAGLMLSGALLCQVAQPIYAARVPGLVGPIDLAAIGALGAGLPALLYALRYRRFLKRRHAAV